MSLMSNKISKRITPDYVVIMKKINVKLNIMYMVITYLTLRLIQIKLLMRRLRMN